jgi:hypothetical protein
MNPAKQSISAHPDVAALLCLKIKNGSRAAALQTRRNSQEHYTIKDTFDEEKAGRFLTYQELAELLRCSLAVPHPAGFEIGQRSPIELRLTIRCCIGGVPLDAENNAHAANFLCGFDPPR